MVVVVVVVGVACTQSGGSGVGWGGGWLLKNERRPSRGMREGKERELGLTGQKETRVRGTREIRVEKERLRESLT